MPLHFEVDSRIGSVHLLPLLTALGAYAVATHLEFGDVALEPSSGVTVGVELKTLGDLLNCIQSRRLVDHQIPGLLNSYTLSYVIVEGVWRCGDDGRVEMLCGREWRPPHGRSGWKYDAVLAFLADLHARWGVVWLPSSAPAQTARLLIALAKYWSVPWDERKQRTHFSGVDVEGAAISGVRPSFAWDIASRLPGIGAKKASRVVAKFGTAEAMAGATPDQWQEIEGIGPETARRIVCAWGGVE